MPESGLEDETDDEEDENPFHDVGLIHHLVGGGLEERLIHGLDLNSGEIKIEVADFLGKLHVEDYLD